MSTQDKGKNGRLKKKKDLISKCVQCYDVGSHNNENSVIVKGITKNIIV